MNNLRCCIGRGLAGIKCKGNVTVNWLIFWYLRSIEKQIASLGSESTFGAINRDDLSNYESFGLSFQTLSSLMVTTS